ncbi:hypothetical protein WMY93_019431 [Mugilogobius chulae]|uniref:WAS/WASL interacting protein family member 3 n=1 Tax=Mugilogobius chulae TaxID=88201 RepID=A0AAW0NH33_9GOBI
MFIIIRNQTGGSVRQKTGGRHASTTSTSSSSTTSSSTSQCCSATVSRAPRAPPLSAGGGGGGGGRNALLADIQRGPGSGKSPRPTTAALRPWTSQSPVLEMLRLLLRVPRADRTHGTFSGGPVRWRLPHTQTHRTEDLTGKNPVLSRLHPPGPDSTPCAHLHTSSTTTACPILGPAPPRLSQCQPRPLHHHSSRSLHRLLRTCSLSAPPPHHPVLCCSSSTCPALCPPPPPPVPLSAPPPPPVPFLPFPPPLRPSRTTAPPTVRPPSPPALLLPSSALPAPAHQTHVASPAQLHHPVPPPPPPPPASYVPASAPQVCSTARWDRPLLLPCRLLHAHLPVQPAAASAQSAPGALSRHALAAAVVPCHAPTRRPPAVPRSSSRLAPPPAPPTRSPSTELTSRIPPPPPPPPLPPSSLRNGHLYSLDDFESKFQFHPVEDLPPPEEFKPFPRVYPSKESRGPPKPPAIRTHLR